MCRNWNWNSYGNWNLNCNLMDSFEIHRCVLMELNLKIPKKTKLPLFINNWQNF
ncbi:hypothetical protein HanRHA438_Chr16g0737071 [Helianthus annuus]|nr:hypothetical protein HanRHA438_Chr16g0737071 [Helianthus annuus]